MIVAPAMLPLLAFLSPSFGEMIVVAIIALLLYGSDLPEVARTWGKTYQEFRRHLSGIRNEINDVIYTEPDSTRRLQYYPEFQRHTVDGDDEVADEVAEVVADQCDSPVARAVEEAEAAKLAAETNETGSDDPTVRHDTHGAA